MTTLINIGNTVYSNPVMSSSGVAPSPGVGTALTLEDSTTAFTLEDGATALTLEDA